MTRNALLVATRWRGFIVLAVLYAFTLAAPWWADASLVRDLIELSCWVGLAIAWNLLAGYGGMVSIGQQAFLGLGAYAAFAAVDLAGAGFAGALLAAAALTAIAALAFAPLLFRLQGGYFAIGSWVVAETLRLAISSSETLGGSSGLSLRWDDGIGAERHAQIALWVAATFVFGAQALVVSILRAPLGLALAAMRDDAAAAQSQGVPVGRVRLLVFVAAAVAFGVFGAIDHMVALRVSPGGAFDVRWAVLVIFMVVIGGVGTVEGPVIGAMLFFVLDRAFSEYGSQWLIALGVLAVVFAVSRRGGLWSLAERIAKRPLTLFPARWH